MCARGSLKQWINVQLFVSSLEVAFRLSLGMWGLFSSVVLVANPAAAAATADGRRVIARCKEQQKNDNNRSSGS